MRYLSNPDLPKGIALPESLVWFQFNLLRITGLKMNPLKTSGGIEKDQWQKWVNKYSTRR